MGHAQQFRGVEVDKCGRLGATEKRRDIARSNDYSVFMSNEGSLKAGASFGRWHQQSRGHNNLGQKSLNADIETKKGSRDMHNRSELTLM